MSILVSLLVLVTLSTTDNITENIPKGITLTFYYICEHCDDTRFFILIGAFRMFTLFSPGFKLDKSKWVILSYFYAIVFFFLLLQFCLNARIMLISLCNTYILLQEKKSCCSSSFVISKKFEVLHSLSSSINITFLVLILVEIIMVNFSWNNYGITRPIVWPLAYIPNAASPLVCTGLFPYAFKLFI